MDVIGTLPALSAAGVGTAVALKSPELLKELYGDLAKPGVSQVGKAIGSVLGIGNTILIPLRLLNEAGRAFEQRSFEQIADRFKTIPEEEVAPAPPEVSIPILEKLSQTHDKTLREMFIELLAKASTVGQMDQVHPSFAQVIGSIVPDEAILLRSLQKNTTRPFVVISLGYEGTKQGKSTVHDLIMEPPSEMQQPLNAPLFLSNLSGLGAIEIHRDGHLTAPDAYDSVIAYAKRTFPFPDKIDVGGQIRTVHHDKSFFNLSPYGKRLIDACT